MEPKFTLIPNDENVTVDSEIKIKTYDSRQVIFIVCLILGIILQVYLYVLTLEGCKKSQVECLLRFNDELIYKFLIYMSVSALIFTLILILTFKNLIGSYVLITNSIIMIYLLFVYDTGHDLAHHGAYNSIIFILLVLIYSLIYFVFQKLTNLILMKYYKTLFLIILFIIVIIIFKNQISYNSCQNWKRGIKLNDEINNESKEFSFCRIETPKSCWTEILDGIFDVSRILKDDCKIKRSNEKQQFLKSLNRKSTSHSFYYPDTTKFDIQNESLTTIFYYNLMNRTKSKLDTSENQDIEISFSDDNKGKVKFHIKKNETLVNERKLNSNSSTAQENQIKNILFIYIDAISRVHFQRKMKKTIEFIKESIDYDYYQFMKYHSLEQFTNPNVIPMFYGSSIRDQNGTHILKYLHEQGYITAHSNNVCTRELFDLDVGAIENLTYVPYDHENIAIFCDPNYHDVNDRYPPVTGPYGIRRKCLYGEDTFEFVIKYGFEFWNTYKNEKKYMRLGFIDAHEGTGEVVTYLDRPLKKFLDKLKKMDLLNDTAIIFGSDHGNHMMGLYKVLGLEDFTKEKTLGILVLMLPKYYKMNLEYKENIEFNKQVLITAYDIHDTILHLAGISSNYFSNLGMSLLMKIDYTKRNCDYYSKDMAPDRCRCT